MSPDNISWRIAVFASGSGTNLQALIDAVKAGDINGEIVVVVTNTKNAYALDRAKEAKIETMVYDPKDYTTRTLWCAKIANALKRKDVNLVCLAGFMLKLEPCMVRAFQNRIINIHPALLPKFGGKGMYGHHVHEAVLTADEKESGCTIHLVDEQFDHGPIIAQSKVEVAEGDTPDSLAQKIHKKEHELYVSVVKDICSGTLNLDEVASKEPMKKGD
jgi:formyltetrahydrofolate-dependent phosphoribosylglycinamide formyltransferase